MNKFLFALLIAMSAPVAGAADDALDALNAMRACSAQADDDRRLACFDAAMKALTTPAATTSQESFGCRGEVAREALDRKKEEEASPTLEQLEAKVTAVRLQPRGEFVVTLDNGQVWAQKRPEARVRPVVGDTISIKPGALGSFLLVTTVGRSTRVTRVR